MEYRSLAGLALLLLLVSAAHAAEYVDGDDVFSFSHGTNWQVTPEPDGTVAADCIAGGCAHQGSCIFSKIKVEFGAADLFGEEVMRGLAQGQIEGFSQLGPTEQINKYVPRRLGVTDGILSQFRSKAPGGAVHFWAFATWHKNYLIQVICRGPERLWEKACAPEVNRLVATLVLRQ